MTDGPTSPITSGLPLFFVITVTAIKQGYEDWLRRNSDNEVNGAAIYVVRSGGLVKIRSKNIWVGDIVQIAKDEIFPEDSVLPSSDRPDGSCPVTTANLHGETNLKTHVAVPEATVSETVANLYNLMAAIECQQPEAGFYRYMGKMITQQMEGIICSVQSDGIGDGPWQSSLASSELEYYASSPDEKVLVEAAARIGIVFTGSSEETVEIKILGKLERYKLLHVLEFDSGCRRSDSGHIEMDPNISG
ncbi:Putative phospholipid-transporting ATPase IF [Fukomys damarensis]|uniref:Putative phospholipid-transporting ATPase IF n=1 Tax=Fukomys damarensis TaxID=885580 RepID=A0A091EFL5_FUKDA|nr:Putative phospholipid-transporting ATPase IF [Fukomys damarensis]